MTTYLGKSCSFCLPRAPFRKLSSIYVFSYFPFGFEGRMWDLIVSVPDHCLSFYFFYISLHMYNLARLFVARLDSSSGQACQAPGNQCPSIDIMNACMYLRTGHMV